MDFIRKLFSEREVKEYNNVENLIFDIYKLERLQNGNKIIDDRGMPWYEEEYHLLNLYHDKNCLLVLKVGLEYLIECVPDLKEEDGIMKLLGSYDDAIVEKIINILNSCIWISTVKQNNVIFGKERNLELYINLFEQLTSNQHEIKEQGKQKLFKLS